MNNCVIILLALANSVQSSRPKDLRTKLKLSSLTVSSDGNIEEDPVEDDICTHDPSTDGKVFKTVESPPKSTYISWSSQLEALMANRTGKTSLTVEIKPGVTRKVTDSDTWPVTAKLADVGGDKQEQYKISKNKNKSIKMKGLGLNSPTDTIGLMTGGNMDIRKTNKDELTTDCKAEDENCMGFFPLDPVDETVFTLKAAVDAWKKMPGPPKCPLMLLIVGSTDLHAGLVDTDGILKYYTITNYVNEEPKARGFEDGQGGEDKFEDVRNKILKDMEGNVVAVGGSTGFYEPLDKFVEEKCPKCSNAFVGLTTDILAKRPPDTKKKGKEDDYPHLKAGFVLEKAGAKGVYLAARG